MDRITAEHEVIHRHNMLPDAGVDQQVSLNGRLSVPAQSFHDLIGLDDAVLQQTERVNRDSIYAIYDGELPEQDDALDSIAAALEANALLNRVRRERRWRSGNPVFRRRRCRRTSTAAGRKRPPRRNRQSESRPMPAASRGNWGNCV